jgi:hypothetical protein
MIILQTHKMWLLCQREEASAVTAQMAAMAHSAAVAAAVLQLKTAHLEAAVAAVAGERLALAVRALAAVEITQECSVAMAAVWHPFQFGV